MIIGFTGNKGVGKTTAAESLRDMYCANQRDKFIKLFFAEPIYTIAKLMGWNGRKDERGRRLLQRLGTECGREYDPNIWVKKLEEVYLHQSEYMNNFTIDDVRFNNEAEWIVRNGGLICKIHRDGFNGDDHASEQGVDSRYISYVIFNNGTIHELKIAVMNLLKGLNNDYRL